MQENRSTEKSKGFSLVEVLFSLAAISVLVTGGATYFNSRMKEQRVLSIQNSKAMIVQILETTITDPLSIMASYNSSQDPANQMLKQCVFGVCPRDYLKLPNWTGPSSMHPLSEKLLFQLRSSDGQGLFSNLSGKWSEDGTNNCTATDFLSCPYLVRSFFWFQCDPNAMLPNGDCRTTTQVYLMFQIMPSDPIEAKRRGLTLHYPGNTEQVANPMHNSYVISVRELRALEAQNPCGQNQYLESYDSKGNAKCKCFNNEGFIPGISDPAGRPVCKESQLCPQGLVLQGYLAADDSGVSRPNCVAPQYSVPQGNCFTRTLESGINECPAGYAVAHIEYGTCTVKENVAKNKKGALEQEDLECGADQATCCPRG